MKKTNLTKIYVCGPTVYDESHLGHARTYMIVDILNRIMNSIANSRTYLVMNITDIDDKIVDKARDTSTHWYDIAKKYEKSYFDAMAKLNVKLPDTIIRVSDSIPQIVKYIQKIIDNGFAYMTSDLSIYFDSNKYAQCGYLSDNSVEESVCYSSISPSIKIQKRNRKDFSLWKSRNKTEIGFDAEFTYEGITISSWGRPGWHIECSAMIHETIGPDLDIHFGGIDLKFPHHHNERLQAHAFYHPKFMPKNQLQSTQWSSLFLHIGHLCIKGLKMSKSLKNFTTIDEALKEISPNQLRWMFIIHKWNEQMDFSDDTIGQAKTFDNTMANFFNRIINYPFEQTDIAYNDKESKLSDYFFEVKNKITSDLCEFKLDTANFTLFELINKANSYISTNNPNASLIKKIYDWIFNLVTILGFEYQKNSSDSIENLMNVLINTRSEIRKLTRDMGVTKEFKQKIFKILDIERDIMLPSIGITLQDTKDSSSWFKNT